MKTKTLLLLVGFILFDSISILSQSNSSPKNEFVYKTVNGHAIKANIFLPKTNDLLPVVVFFMGDSFSETETRD
jgi:cephalosporin-C deacetylase-like acetyl esterase